MERQWTGIMKQGEMVGMLSVPVVFSKEEEEIYKLFGIGIKICVYNLRNSEI
jgi:hypothetical protein